MKLVLYRLQPRSPFQFALEDLSSGAPLVRSDTLFSAVCLALRDLLGPMRLNSFLRGATNTLVEPPARLSSAFPYAGGTLFLPRPATTFKHQGDARLVSLTAFGKAAAGEPVTGASLHDGLLLVDPADAEGLPADIASGHSPLWRTFHTRRAAVSRDGAAVTEDDVFTTGQVAFTDGCGLAVLAKVEDSWRDEVDAAFRFLGESGIGGGKSTGAGQFDLSIESIVIPSLPNPTGYCTLSLYVPTATEINGQVLGEPATYDLVERGGWIGSPEGAGVRRKRVRMITEGSVLAPASVGPERRAPSGHLVDVAPDGVANLHRVYRAGWALAIGIRGAA